MSYKSKYPIAISNVDIKQILISDKVSYHKKGSEYFIGYKDNDKAKLTCIMLPEVSGYNKFFDEIKFMSFLIENKKLLETCNKL